MICNALYVISYTRYRLYAMGYILWLKHSVDVYVYIHVQVYDSVDVYGYVHA